MSHQVCWSKLIVAQFVADAMLTADEEHVLRTRVAGHTRVQQSMELGMSLATIDRITARLKAKYDKVEKHNPLLPPRRFSAKETYLDEN